MKRVSLFSAFRNSFCYSIQSFKSGSIMQNQVKKKQTFDAQTRQLSIQVLGNACDSATRSVLLITDSKRFLFNCGESTQRDFQEYGTKLLNTEQFFFTSTQWQNIGGLSATLLMIDRAHTMRNRQVTVHGPQNMQYLLSCVQSFVQIKNTKVSLECNEEGVLYLDKSLIIRCAKIKKDFAPESQTPQDSSKTESILERDSSNSLSIDLSQSDSNSKRKGSTDTVEEQQIKKQKTLLDSNALRVSDVFCYICEGSQIPGKLLMEKCMEKGVPCGPLLSKLKSGGNVTLDDGTVVYSKDVCLPPTQGVTVIILECPGEDYIDSLTNHPAILEYQTSETVNDKRLSCICHFTPENILQNPRYQAWMKKFPSRTHHIILNEKNGQSVSEASRKLQHKLNMLHPAIYPLLSVDSRDVCEKKCMVENDPYFHRAAPQLRVQLQPIEKFYTMYPEVNPKTYIREALLVDGFKETLTELRNKFETLPQSLKDTDLFPRVIFLGTGSALGTTVRNVSGILVRLDEEHSIILDCGDGTVRQIYTLYGFDKGSKLLSTIKAIFVSHMHADHHSGLIGVMQERAKITNAPVYLIGPSYLYSFLSRYDQVFEPVCHLFNPAPSSDFTTNKPTDKIELYQSLNLSQIRTSSVVHTKHSIAIRFTLQSGYSIAYSGDTRPCQEMVNLAKDVDLLIHEATMGDDQISLAVARKHSTVSEALDIAKQARAKHTILTHLSQRYSKAPITSIDALPLNVGIASDFMEIGINMLPLLHDLYRGVSALNDPNADILTIEAEEAIGI